MSGSNDHKRQFSATTLVVVLIFLSLIVYSSVNKDSDAENISDVDTKQDSLLTRLRTESVILPVVWGDIGKQMIGNGVIDKEKFESLYESRGGLAEDVQDLLYSDGNKEIVMNRENASVILNILWAFGLSNKNSILEEGAMSDPQYGSPGRFASTGGWSLASGSAMNHYSKYDFVVLDDEKQKLVEEVSANIFRPCCGNPTSFPDCNHGMAMLGLLELLAHQGVDEETMYDLALQVNSLWFPSTYDVLALYVEKENVNLTSKGLLSSEYSSLRGYRDILAKVEPSTVKQGASCGV